ncbi:DUF1876 domain-containing protein [Streptomyces sp. NPDC026672]|uniref:DUF1876 domain-containing protein n=1 Tax=unclassified Streptomyces TaxID=2593676 RepID=UPI003402DCFD
MRAKRWTVQIFITEEGDDTRARAVLTTHDTTALSGLGTARRSPADPAVPEIGDELAAGRALEALALRLRDAATEDLAWTTGPSPRR